MWVQILIKGGVESSSTNQKGIFGICEDLGGTGAKDGVQRANP